MKLVKTARDARPHRAHADDRQAAAELETRVNETHADLQSAAARHPLRAASSLLTGGRAWPSCRATPTRRRDLVDAGAGRSRRSSAENELQPLNRSGDEEGCHYENGVVPHAEGLQGSLRQVHRGRLDRRCPAIRNTAARACRKVINFAVEEMICSANLSFGMYPGLTHGAYNALHLHGTDEQKQRLSAEAGRRHLDRHHVPDRAALRHRSRPDQDQGGARHGDGRYRITGTKIFISAGEHDLTENIIHLVLARLPDAPAGIQAASALFLVPKFLPDADGTPGPRNGVALRLDRAQDGHQGLVHLRDEFRRRARAGWSASRTRACRAMFTMMNAARLGVGMQGLGLAEVAYQNAVTYATDRLQGRSLTRRQGPGEAGRSDHRASRRAAHAADHAGARPKAAARSAYWIGMELDISQQHPGRGAPAGGRRSRRAADADREGVLHRSSASTPPISACRCIGGHGYIRE